MKSLDPIKLLTLIFIGSVVSWFVIALMDPFLSQPLGNYHPLAKIDLRQKWSLFVPPIRLIKSYEAKLYSKQGEIGTWTVPQSSSLSILDQVILGTKLRKFYQHRANPRFLREISHSLVSHILIKTKTVGLCSKIELYRTEIDLDTGQQQRRIVFVYDPALRRLID